MERNAAGLNAHLNAAINPPLMAYFNGGVMLQRAKDRGNVLMRPDAGMESACGVRLGAIPQQLGEHRED